MQMDEGFRRTTPKQSSGFGSRLHKEMPTRRRISELCTLTDKVFRRTTTKQSSGIGSRLRKEDPKAQTEIGVMYEKGKGVPKDYDEAVKWYRLAVAQENVDAKTNLGVMYSYG